MTDQRLHVTGGAVLTALFESVSWRAIVLRGVAGILFGLFAMMAPIAAATTIVLVFSIYLMADGFLAIASAIKAARRKNSWGLLVLEGVVDIITSLVLFLMPGLALVTFVIIVAVWALFAGGLKLIAAFRSGPVQGRGWLVLSAIISLLFGVVLLISPLAGGIVLTWWLGIYGLVFGVALLILGFQVRSAQKKAVPAA